MTTRELSIRYFDTLRSTQFLAIYAALDIETRIRQCERALLPSPRPAPGRTEWGLIDAAMDTRRTRYTMQTPITYTIPRPTARSWRIVEGTS